jgi:hypothetical protein
MVWFVGCVKQEEEVSRKGAKKSMQAAVSIQQLCGLLCAFARIYILATDE